MAFKKTTAASQQGEDKRADLNPTPTSPTNHPIPFQVQQDIEITY